MTEHGTGGSPEYQDTAQVDLRQGSALQRPLPPVHSSGHAPHPAPPPPRQSSASAGALASRPVPDQAPLHVTGPVPAPEVPTVERHLDEILAAVPQPDSIELAVLDAQG